MIPQERVTGNSTAINLGLYSLNLENRDDFIQYLLDSGYADSQSRANTVWTQAREFYYGDTGTVTARPHRTPVNLFASIKTSSDSELIPFFTKSSDADNWNAEISPNTLTRRPQSGSIDLPNTIAYIQDAGLIGLAVVVVEGDFSFAWVLKDSV